MVECDKQIEAWLQNQTKGLPPQEPKVSSKVRHNAPQIEHLHEHLVTLCEGRDAAALPGISQLGFMKLVGELGTDLSGWKDQKHFTAWLGLAPGRNESGKRRKRASRRKTRCGQIFKEAAMSVGRSKGLALGAFYRRIRGRTCAAVANTATARKIAILYYNLMTKGVEYVEHGLEEYQRQYQQQSVKHVKKMAKSLGMAVVDIQTGVIM